MASGPQRGATATSVAENAKGDTGGPPASAAPTYRYLAFISYKHGPSARDHAVDLEHHLKTYARSPYTPPRRIFRDERHIVPGVPLGPTIKAALEASEFFILLASKEAADSTWVQDELKHWCENLGRSDRLIVLLIDDTIAVQTKLDVADTKPLERRGIDWTRTDALPRLLREFVSEEPLYGDLRWARLHEQRTLEDPRYKTLVNAVVARLLGKDPDEMLSIEFRAHRAQLRVRNGAIAAIVTLVVTSGVAGATAWSSRVRSRQAQASSYAEQARTASRLGFSEAASVLGAEALSLDDTKLAHRFLGSELHPLPKLVATSARLGAQLRSLSFLGRDDRLIALTDAGSVSFLHRGIGSPEALAPLATEDTPELEAGALGMAVSRDGRQLVLAFARRGGGELIAYDVSARPTLLRRVSVAVRPELVALSPNKTLAAVVGSEGQGPPVLTLVDLGTGRSRTFRRPSGSGFVLSAIAFDASGTKLALGDAFGQVTEWPIPDGPLTSLPRGAPFAAATSLFCGTTADSAENVVSLAFSNDRASLFAASSIDGKVGRIVQGYGPEVFETGMSPQLHALAVSADDTYVVAAGRYLSPDLSRRAHHAMGLVALFHTQFPTQLAQRLLHGEAPFTAVAISPSGSLLATGDADGIVTLWRSRNYGDQFEDLPPGTDAVKRVSIASHHRDVAILDVSRALLLRQYSAQGRTSTETISDVLAVRLTDSGDGVSILRQTRNGGTVVEQWRGGRPDDGSRWRPASLATVSPILVAISPDASSVIAAVPWATRGSLLMLDRAGAERIYALLPGESVRDVEFGRGNRRAAVVTSARVLLVDDTRANARYRVVPIAVRDRDWRSARVSPSGRYLVAFDGETLAVFDLQRSTTRELPVSAVSQVEFLRDERYLVAVSTPVETALTVFELPSLDDRSDRIDLGLAKGDVVGLAVSPSDAVIAVAPACTGYRGVRLYDVSNVLRAIDASREDGARLGKLASQRYGWTIVNGVAVSSAGTPFSDQY